MSLTRLYKIGFRLYRNPVGVALFLANRYRYRFGFEPRRPTGFKHYSVWGVISYKQVTPDEVLPCTNNARRAPAGVHGQTC